MAKVTSTRYNVRRAKGVGLGVRAGDDDKEGEGERWCSQEARGLNNASLDL